MEWLVTFANSYLFFILVPLLGLVAWYRAFYYKGIRYRFPLTNTLKRAAVSHHPHKKILYALRSVILLGLIVCIGKPQIADPRARMQVEGIDIMLVLDVSGSMSMPHHAGDSRSRIEVAQEEAIRFINKRANDALGIVLFGNDAVSRCPLTVDKNILHTIVRDVAIGVINPEGTVVSTAVITAANRLKHSTAKSRIMILLTDGEPSENDADPMLAIEVAKKLGIKIYTVGIGDDQEVLMQHPFYGPIPMKTTLNKTLLTNLAQATGGMFFEAKNGHDMRRIYDTIDRLEKSSLDVPLTSYQDFFIPIIWFLLALLIIEVIARSWVWFSL